MSQFSFDEISSQIAQIVEQFSLLECDQCAKAVLQWLKEHELEGKLLRLTTMFGEDFIISIRLENQGITDSITVNGIHYGVEIQGRVFDNLSSNSLTRNEWILDFHCISDRFIVEELDEFE